MAESSSPAPTDTSTRSPSAGSVPFDPAAAASALAAVDVAACKEYGGPVGHGHASIAFGNDGTVLSAVVDAPPFAGTSVGRCVAEKFRAVKVPTFDGRPIKVGKAFVIN